MRLIWIVAVWLALLAVPAQAAPKLEDFARLPAADLVSLSPAGDLVALVMRDGAGAKLQVVRTDGTEAYSMPLPSAKVRSVECAGADHLIVQVSETLPESVFAKHEFYGGYFINARAGKGGVIFGQSRRMVGAILGFHGFAKVDGRPYGYFGGISGQDIRSGSNWGDLYSVDLETGRESLVTMAGTGPARWSIGADGKVSSMSQVDGPAAEITIYAGLRDKVLFKSSTKNRRVAMLGLGRTPRSALVSIVEPSGDSRVVEFKEGGPPEGEVLLSGAARPELLRGADDLLIGVAAGGKPRFFDPAAQARAEAALKPFAGLQTLVTSWDENQARFVIYTHGSRDSGTYWLVDSSKGSASPIAYARPEVEPDDVAVPRPFSYKAGDGMTVRGLLTLPNGRPAKGLPLIVLPHDGPVAEPDRPGFHWLAQAFASRGYAVLQPNYRGGLGYGDDFRKAGEGQVGRKMQTDLSDGVAALAAQGLADAGRVCIAGIGYGGYAALAGVTLQKGVYRCAISINGVSHYGKVLVRAETGISPDLTYLRSLRDLLGDGSGLDAVAPQAQAAAADAPVLLIHGEDDLVTPIEHSRDMERALRRAGKPVELLTLADEDHWVRSEPARRQLLESAIAFVEKHNPPAT